MNLTVRQKPEKAESRPGKSCVTDLEHADGAHEWNRGANDLSTGTA
ncbi:hypothetical protein N7U49_28010 [Streptomyces sp. AD2-2]|nr:hypothetical protein N7U49_28010 [Streptomyces sp. AD2-2]